MKNPYGVRAASHVRHSAANGTRVRGGRGEDGEEAEEVTKEEPRSEVKKNPAAAAVGK